MLQICWNLETDTNTFAMSKFEPLQVTEFRIRPKLITNLSFILGSVCLESFHAYKTAVMCAASVMFLLPFCL